MLHSWSSLRVKNFYSECKMLSGAVEAEVKDADMLSIPRLFNEASDLNR